MPILKMKRLRLVGMLADRDALFTALQHMGCVQVTEQSDKLSQPEWAALVRPNESTRIEKEKMLEETQSALEALDAQAPAKAPLLAPKPQVLEEELFSAEAISSTMLTVRRLNANAAALREDLAQAQRLKAAKLSLLPWGNLDLPLDTASTASCLVQFGTLPSGVKLEAVRAELTAAADAAELYESSADTELHYLLLLCHRAQEEAALEVLKPYGFSPAAFKDITGTAAENIAALDRQLEELSRRIADIKKAIAAYAPQRQALEICYDRLSQEIEKERNKERVLDTGTAFLLEGWVPEENEAQLTALMDKFGCAYSLESPNPEDYPEVPVELKDGTVAASLNTVTNMYSLPAYGTVDPNPLMTPFFILFYGMMMADMGYGILMILGCALIIKKKRLYGKKGEFFRLFLYCGFSTVAFGLATGSFFGDFIPQLTGMLGHEVTLPSLFSPLDNALAVLVGALALGLVQIFTGMAVSMYRQIKAGELMAALCNEGAWYLVFVLIGVAALTGAVKPCVIAIAVLLVLTQGYGKKGILGKLMGIFGSLYNNITGYFSDILSYSRLMALMLSGAVIAQVFNTLAALTGNVITFFIIAMVGNGLNMALNLLGCYVHDMRLQCLEFFGRFYEDGGKPFEPVKIDTKYVDIISQGGN